MCACAVKAAQESSGKIFYYKGTQNQLASQFSFVNYMDERQGNNNVFSVLRGKEHSIVLCPTECSVMNVENRKTFLCN